MSESLQELVQDDADLTQYAGIGDAIAAAIREIVQTGSLRKLETLRAQASPAVASISDYPSSIPKRVQRVYKKLPLRNIEEPLFPIHDGEAWWAVFLFTYPTVGCIAYSLGIALMNRKTRL